MKNNQFLIDKKIFDFKLKSGFNITSKFHQYELSWGKKGILKEISFYEKNHNSFFIIDKKVFELYFKDKIKIKNLFLVDAVEDSKSLIGVSQFMQYLLKNGVNKGSKVVCIGGGIIQDITSFSCSCYKRGIDWIFIPTTFLAMCDSCIGSKSGINFGDGKNQLGLFFPPKKIILYEDFLSSLPQDILMSGIGEALKLSITGGKKSFDDFNNLFFSSNLRDNLPSMIDLSLSVKKLVVEHDEFELNERKSMNYGHTFAHAIEKITSFAIPHGFAVTLGLILANRLRNKLDFLPLKEMNKLDEVSKKVLSLYDLNKISSFNFKDIGNVMLTDKKAVNDTVSFVLVSEVGKTFFLKQKIDQRFSKVIHSVVDEVISEILSN